MNKLGGGKMYRKIIVAVGAILLILSLAFPITVTKQVHIERPVESGGILYKAYIDSLPKYKDVTEVDTYKTGIRSIAILIGTLTLVYIVPSGKKEEQEKRG